MRPRIAVIAPVLVVGMMVAGLSHSGRAWERERGPVCREPSVIDEMTRVVRSGNYYSRIDDRLVTEQPTIDPRVVQCQVCVQMTPYDSLRYGDRPIRQCVARGFEVRILPAGFVVRDLR